MFWATFLGSFVVIALWETFGPARPLEHSTGRRWTLSGILAVTNSFVHWLIQGGAAVLVASAATGRSWGLLSNERVPEWFAYAVTLPILDLVRYFQHRGFHTLPWLWRFHRVHHSDPDYDLTTALRFHPGEAVFTELFYLMAIGLLGPPPLAVLGVEMVVVFQNFFAHANAKLPDSWRRTLHWVLITPDLHRRHHSVVAEDQQTNFGTLFPWWDRLFGTYRPEAPAEGFAVGIGGVTPESALSLAAALKMPFQPMTESSTTVRSSSTSSASSTPSETTVNKSPTAIGRAAS